MRKKFLTKEYSLENRPGTLSMLEKKNFFSSKIMEIPDLLTVDETNIVWNESVDSTQLINIDDQTKILNTSDLKKKNHTIQRSPRQSERDVREYTNYDFTINIKTVVNNWIFAQLKKYQTFGGIKNNETAENNIDAAIQEYIDLNIFPRIKFDTINLYIRYFQIGTLDESGLVSLQYDIRYNDKIIVPPAISGESTDQLVRRSLEYKNSLKVGNYELTLDTFEQIATLKYKQTQSSQFYKFNYYFDVVYRKA
jgi:hypothetical protein